MTNTSEAVERRRNARRTFGPHLTTYLFINLLLFLFDAQTGGGWWFFWPLIGWGIGLANHAWLAFGTLADVAEPSSRDLHRRGGA